MDGSVTDPPEVSMESKKRSKNFLAAVRRISGVRLIQMVYLTVILAFIGYVAYATFSQYLQMQSALLTIKSNITPSILRADKIRNEILSTGSK
jgi:hypothetical protein